MGSDRERRGYPEGLRGIWPRRRERHPRDLGWMMSNGLRRPLGPLLRWYGVRRGLGEVAFSPSSAQP